MDEKQIIKDAISKHNLVLNPEDENLQALVRYALNIGYSNGYKDGSDE